MSESDGIGYGLAAVIQGEGEVTNLHFHSEGKHLLASSGQSSIHFIDCNNGEEKKKIHCKSTGVGHISFSHHDQCVLVTSRLKPFNTSYLCLYDNRYLMKLEGHEEYITSLSMSPINDTFLTASEDHTVRQWDLLSGKETMKIQLPTASSSVSPPTAHFDCSGLVYGVHVHTTSTNQLQQQQLQHQLKLYDARFTGKGPFENISPDMNMFHKSLQENQAAAVAGGSMESMERYLLANWTSFQFSHEGNHILINTDTELMWILDGFRRDQEPIPLLSRRNEFSNRLGCCWLTDDRHVLTGSADSDCLLVDAKTGEVVTSLVGHVSQVGQTASNPKYQVLASGCVNIALWLPLATGMTPNNSSAAAAAAAAGSVGGPQ
eukprot:gene10334-11439_t